MAFEAEVIGRRIDKPAWDMIVKRYEVISGFIDKNKKLLDVGCGAGLGLEVLSEHSKFIVAIDYEEENIQEAKKNNEGLKNVLIKQMDAHKLLYSEDFPFTGFDVISAMEVIQYLDMNKFLPQVNNLLKQDGAFIACLPNIERLDGFTHSEQAVNYFTKDELISLFNKHGFNVGIYGVFSIDKNITKSKLKTKLMQMANKLLMSFEAGRAFKEKLKSKSDNYTTIRKIHQEDLGDVSSMMTTYANNRTTAHKHKKILYVVATKK